MNSDNPDAALVCRALAGEQQAARQLVERHREGVYRLARSATGDAEEAFDITQDTFVAAFAALHRYDPARPFRGWIAAIALNKCRDHMRRGPLGSSRAELIVNDAVMYQYLFRRIENVSASEPTPAGVDGAGDVYRGF